MLLYILHNVLQGQNANVYPTKNKNVTLVILFYESLLFYSRRSPMHVVLINGKFADRRFLITNDI